MHFGCIQLTAAQLFVKDFIREVLMQHPVHKLCEFLFILLLAEYRVDTYVCACACACACARCVCVCVCVCGGG